MTGVVRWCGVVRRCGGAATGTGNACYTFFFSTICRCRVQEISPASCLLLPACCLFLPIPAYYSRLILPTLLPNVLDILHSLFAPFAPFAPFWPCLALASQGHPYVELLKEAGYVTQHQGSSEPASAPCFPILSNCPTSNMSPPTIDQVLDDLLEDCETSR
jgi:hypothetical protein